MSFLFWGGGTTGSTHPRPWHHRAHGRQWHPQGTLALLSLRFILRGRDTTGSTCPAHLASQSAGGPWTEIPKNSYGFTYAGAGTPQGQPAPRPPQGPPFPDHPQGSRELGFTEPRGESPGAPRAWVIMPSTGALAVHVLSYLPRLRNLRQDFQPPSPPQGFVTSLEGAYKI